MTITILTASVICAILGVSLLCIWKSGREAEEMLRAAAEMVAEAERTGQ